VNLSIGDVARRTGLSVHTLRMYEREGLLATPPSRDASGRRVYGEADVEWLEYCTRFRASGMPLSAIRRFTELVREGPGNEHERLALLKEHEERVLGRIAELRESLAVIRGKVTVYEEHVAAGRVEGLWSPPTSTRD
jgi:DNA-binding transcriptional MerR regulator